MSSHAETCTAGWLIISPQVCIAGELNPNCYQGYGWSLEKTWITPEEFQPDDVPVEMEFCLSANMMSGEIKKIARLRQMFRNYQIYMKVADTSDSQNTAWTREIVPLILDAIELSQTIAEKDLYIYDHKQLKILKKQLESSALDVLLLEGENEIRGLDFKVTRTRIEKILGPIRDRKDLSSIFLSLFENDPLRFTRLIQLLPEGAEPFRNKIGDEWYNVDHNIIIAALYPINKLIVKEEQLPALEARLRVIVKRDPLINSNDWYSFHMAQSYIKSTIQYIRILNARATKLLALDVRLKSENISESDFIISLEQSTSLSKNQLENIKNELKSIGKNNDLKNKLIQTLIESQLKTIKRRIKISEEKMVEISKLVKNHAVPELEMLIDGYLALYQLEPERVLNSLNTSIAGLSLSKYPDSAIRAINDLVDSVKLTLEDIENISLSIDGFQKDIQLGHYSILDQISEIQNQPEVSANPQLILILQEAVSDVSDSTSAGIALQINLSELIQDTYADFKNALAAVPSMKVQ